MSLPRATDIQGTWEYIAKGVEIIMVKDLAKGGLTTEMYMNMYTAIHNCCVATSQTPAPRSSAALGSSARTSQSQLLGGDIYQRLKDYLIHHLEHLRRDAEHLVGIDLIQYYNQCWLRYTMGAKYLDHIFSYINRHWVKHERDEGGRQSGVYEVSVLCLVLWRDYLFTSLSQALVEALLQQIESSREGNPAQVTPLQLAISSMVSIGLDDQNSKRTSLSFYTKNFEEPFIEATAAYYMAESQRYLNEHGVVEYMRLVDQRLQEEHQRVAMYLHPNTEERLISVCEKVLIEDNQEIIQDQFIVLLSANREEECNILYRLLSKVPHSLEPVQDMLTTYVEQQGLLAVDALIAEHEGIPEPRVYVSTLLKVHDHFDELVKKSFGSSPGMLKAVNTGFTTVINQNLIARPADKNGNRAKDSKTPELLARFSDSLLKKSSKNADNVDVESSLAGILRLLQFVGERDAFEKHYTRLLSRRLVHQTSANQEMEISMVSRLTEVCGMDYTNKLNKMFSDITMSTEMQQQFKQHNPYPSVEFTPIILADGFWPLPHQKVEFSLPEKLQKTLERFLVFYEEIHSGRKLKWLWNFGKAELKVNFAKSSRSGYVLQVSVFQMVVLLLYNDTTVLTIDEIIEKTGLPAELAIGALTYIVKAHILKQTPAAAPLGAPGTEYSLNKDFKSKKMRINLNLPLKSELRHEATEAQAQIQEERNMFLQTVIVRIMKARREQNHASLVHETMEMAQKRFSPTTRDIKKAISALVDNEYLKREGTDQYVYLA
ncbi:Cullin-1 [Wickerhamiella sorbophila]|uniref:Cullin-1 n=1 Tax=Wickerhamiella sorbophila TaxID=45607 RepID=A0A2T0FFU9_9ASCO|nr:Cullin-1 [Wickerhamiella sorbophila]PRT53872.1 Cullin-1 [Wickerhamiella sorbophila]